MGPVRRSKVTIKASMHCSAISADRFRSKELFLTSLWRPRFISGEAALSEGEGTGAAPFAEEDMLEGDSAEGLSEGIRFTV
jgi:hypothetical protein